MAGDFSVGDWIVRPERLCMRLPGKTVHVTPKAMAVLECLAEAKGHVVTRNDILDKVWPGAAITDDVLTQCVVELRKAFDDCAHDPQYIETIPRKGLRLLPPVSDVVEQTGSETKGLRGRRIGLIVAAVAAILASGIWFLLETWQESASVSSPELKTVAVLPFADTGPTGDQAHIADGISEEVIARLGSIEDLLVVGRSSSFRHRDTLDDIEKVARDLGVRYLLEGSVRRSGNEIRVTAQLVDTDSGYQLWAGTYDRTLEDIFAVQDEIAESVARALSLKLNVGVLKNAGTRNAEAFEAYWLGVEAYYDGDTDQYVDRDGHRRSVDHFRRATRLDPEWAHAWAYLALTYHWGRAHYVEPQPWTELALEALQRANDLAPNQMIVAGVHAQIHTALGNWREAEDGVRRLELLYAAMANIDEKHAAALAVWPTDLAYWAVRLDLNIKTGRAAESVDAAEVLRARYPDGELAALYLQHIYMMLGQSRKAIEILEEIEWISDGLIAALGIGDAELIQPWLMRMVEGEKQIPSWGGINATMAQLLDNRDAALAWLRDAYDRESAPDFWIAIWAGYHDGPEIALDALRRTPDGWAIWLPVMESVRRTPGFVDLVHDIGLVDYWVEFGWGDFCAPSVTGDIVCK